MNVFVLLHVALALPVAYLALVSLYLLVVTLAAYTVRPAPRDREPRSRIGVVIPAHNEQDQIITTVKAVLAADYPPELLRIYVLADNCTDYTAASARQAGAHVYERRNPSLPGKGYALDWLFKRYRQVLRDNDIIVVIDADSIIEPEFLHAAAAALSWRRTAAVQTNNGVANPGANWRTALTYAGFSLINYVRPAGRFRLGGTAGLKGNGMALASHLLAKYGWPAHSLVEDVEFSIRLLIDGWRTGFEPGARIVSDMPETRRQADSQRRRWEFGRIALARQAIPQLARAFMKRPRWRYMDGMLDLAVPPLSLLVMFEAVLLGAAWAVHPFWAAAVAACAGVTVFHVLSGLLLSRAPRVVWISLLAVPLFLMWKVMLYLSAAIWPSETMWIRTPRASDACDSRAAKPAPRARKRR